MPLRALVCRCPCARRTDLLHSSERIPGEQVRWTLATWGAAEAAGARRTGPRADGNEEQGGEMR
jgi:hypothetical protein